MPDSPTPLDLDVIAAAIAECRTYSFGMYQADRLAHEHAPALVEEVNRLRAEVARLAPAWDEEAVVEGMARAVYPFLFADDRQPPRGETRWGAELREGERDVARKRMRQALAVVRDHLPVKVDREAMTRALAEHRLMGGRCRCGLDPRLDYYRYEQHVTDAVLSLLPGRSEAEVAAEGAVEALREAARKADALGIVSGSGVNVGARASAWLDARTITTAAELDALPVGSVILDNMGDAGLIDEDRHGRFVQYVETSRVSLRQAAKHYLPARVLHDPSAPAPAPSGVPEAAVEAARTAARLHSTTEPPPHENHEVCCGECGEAIAYHGCTAEETSERAWRHAYRAALAAALPFLTAAPTGDRRP